MIHPLAGETQHIWYAISGRNDQYFEKLTLGEWPFTYGRFPIADRALTPGLRTDPQLIRSWHVITRLQPYNGQVALFR
jgi:hypothetical protein